MWGQFGMVWSTEIMYHMSLYLSGNIQVSFTLCLNQTQTKPKLNPN